jgi:MoaA/NifB/PqqE/SkfB family radical SAM enzyme
MTATLDHSADTSTGVKFLELEITHRCQLTCAHCLTSSSPHAPRATMTRADWESVITQTAQLGIPQVQFIGGEPLTSPFLVPLLGYALSLGLAVEIFSNLYKVSEPVWDAFTNPRVSLATSYYSDLATEHDRVTRVEGSHTRTRANIIEALRRGIPVRAGIVEVFDGQRVEQARAELETLGVEKITVDRMRAVGRAATTPDTPDVSVLCGRCGLGRAAVLADGTLAPCVLGRFLRTGNVKTTALGTLLAGPAWQAVMQTIPRQASSCSPDGADCPPASTPACAPSYQ